MEATNEEALLMATKNKEKEIALHEEFLLKAIEIMREMAMEDSDSDLDSETGTEMEMNQEEKEKEKYAVEIAKLVKEKVKDFKRRRFKVGSAIDGPTHPPPPPPEHKCLFKKEMEMALHEEALLMATKIKIEMAMEDSDSDTDTETETSTETEMNQKEKEKYAADIAKLIEEREKDLKWRRLTGSSTVFRRRIFFPQPPDLIDKDKLWGNFFSAT